MQTAEPSISFVRMVSGACVGVYTWTSRGRIGALIAPADSQFMWVCKFPGACCVCACVRVCVLRGCACVHTCVRACVYAVYLVWMKLWMKLGAVVAADCGAEYQEVDGQEVRPPLALHHRGELWHGRHAPKEEPHLAVLQPDGHLGVQVLKHERCQQLESSFGRCDPYESAAAAVKQGVSANNVVHAHPLLASSSCCLHASTHSP
jgi:hypothetical protein